MAENLTSWDTDLLSQIPNLPYPAISISVREACRRFCKETWLWRNTLALIDVVGNVSEYTLTIPVALYAELESIPKDGVRYKEDGEDEDAFSKLDCTSEDELDSESETWRYVTNSTPSKFYVDNINKHLHLYPIPEDNSTDGLEVTVILKPNQTCITIPDFLFDDYKDTITEGALEYLFNQKAMDWYDPGEAARHGNEFKILCNKAKWRKMIGPTNKPLTVKVGFFA